MQQTVSPAGRNLPGMPLEPSDSGADDPSLPGSPRQDKPRTPWWRPAGTTGRVFLGIGAAVVLGSLITGIVALKTFLGRDGRFRIAGAANVQATGLTEVSRAEMLPVFGEDIGRNIFFVPLAERRKQLEQIPWVAHATVMRLLPDQIRVSIVERQPVAFVRQGQQIGLVDADGVLLTMPAAMMAQHHYSFPVVTGIDAAEPLPARRARMAVYERLLAELDSNNQRISEQISEIDLTNAEDARVLMPEQGGDILAHYGSDQFLERYQRYKAHIGEWRQQYPKLNAVDLRYDTQVVLEMAQGASASAALPAAATAAGQAKSDSEKTDTGKAEPAPAKPSPAAPAAKSDHAAVQDSAKPAARAVPAKSARKSPAHPRPARAKDKKKRPESRHSVQTVSKQKPAARSHAAAAGQGQ